MALMLVHYSKRKTCTTIYNDAPSKKKETPIYCVNPGQVHMDGHLCTYKNEEQPEKKKQKFSARPSWDSNPEPQSYSLEQ
jgi:hypothetical protein